jgi:hypothetical protein
LYINVPVILVPFIFSAKEKRETKATREKNCYAGMAEEQRRTLRNRRNTPQSHQKQNSSCKMKKDALCLEFIAMENPS